MNVQWLTRRAFSYTSNVGKAQPKRFHPRAILVPSFRLYLAEASFGSGLSP